jgi:hypothetical protein
LPRNGTTKGSIRRSTARGIRPIRLTLGTPAGDRGPCLFGYRPRWAIRRRDRPIPESGWFLATRASIARGPGAVPRYSRMRQCSDRAALPPMHPPSLPLSASSWMRPWPIGEWPPSGSRPMGGSAGRGSGPGRCLRPVEAITPRGPSRPAGWGARDSIAISKSIHHADGGRGLIFWYREPETAVPYLQTTAFS